MMETFVVCENLVKIYKLDEVDVMALQGLDLNVQSGEFVGIVGPSGSGKTTLLNVLGGLDRPSAGRVKVEGEDLLSMTDGQLDTYRRQKVGFVWQQTTRNLIYYLTALENVQLPQHLTGIPVKKSREYARCLLEMLGLGHRLNHYPIGLSGGEQQRVAIAVAMANNPALLLADEPTGEVDSAMAKDIYVALQKVNQDFGTTILIVSHDPDISHFTGRVIAIRDGKTSTETVRVNGSASDSSKTSLSEGKGFTSEKQIAASTAQEVEKQFDFEELVVLDSAGRLQIPREYMEVLNIGDRVRLELKGEKLTIQPVLGRRQSESSPEDENELREFTIADDLPPEKARASSINQSLRLIQNSVRWIRRMLKSVREDER
jgi:putative ABC transport system ATP-binding protein